MKIYIATHKYVNKPQCKGYHLVHVGADLHPGIQLDCESDNMFPDNISMKNDTYCELTALYHIWKHSKEDIVGLVHYRRFFCKKQKIVRNPEHIMLDEEAIERGLNSCDIILGTPQNKQKGFGGFIENPLDISLFTIYRNLLPSIQTLYPEFADVWHDEFRRPQMSYCNMMICSKAVFDEYCEFLFGILFDAERRWQTIGLKVAPREMGYISEYLLNAWVRWKGLTVCYYPIVFIGGMSDVAYKVHKVLEIVNLESSLGKWIDRIYSWLKRTL